MSKDILDKLKALPEAKRAALVVQSHPFGNIIEYDTRIVHAAVPKVPGPNEWQRLAYGLCRAANGDAASEADLNAAGYI